MYDIETDQSTQLTEFKGFDIHTPSIGPEEIVFEADGKLHLYNLSDGSVKAVNINVISDRSNLLPKTVKTHKQMQNAWLSHDGKRAVIEARGDLFSVPASNGPVINLTNTSGSAERFPAWSPDGKKIAYWSDENGEYNLHIMNVESGNKTRLTNFDDGFRYHLYWSPDSKKLAFIDQTMAINIFNTNTNKTTKIDEGLWMFQWGLDNFSVSWSPDSRWMTYSRGEQNRNNSIFIYDTKNEERKRVTSQFYNDYSPSFDADGKYLYFFTNRAMNPTYSNFDNSFIYSKSSQLAVLPLDESVKIPLLLKNDEVEIKEDEEKEESDKKKEKKNDEPEDEEEKDPEVRINFSNIESRIALMPLDPGNYANLYAIKDKLIYHDRTNIQGPAPIMIYDPKENESKEVFGKANGFRMSADGKKILVLQGNELAVINAEPGQNIEDKLPLNEMESRVDPMKEWKQIFMDAWRFQRDYFYDENMHGVDWLAVKDYYGSLVEQANTRRDLNFIIGEMIGELNASHTYRGGGDTETNEQTEVGYLGVNWKADNGYYKISEIVKGAPWDAEAIAPVAMPGININEGDYILAVNGVPLSVDKEPYSAFYGLNGKAVQLTVNDKPSMEGARKELVKAFSRNEDIRLRHLAWIENNRKKVQEATDGRVGYIYVRSTGLDGQAELVRQFAGQWNLDGLIIDERFNSGGQIPDRFIELLNRKPFAYWDVRDGQNWQWPPVGHFGPKAMLINGWSGSGGDAFPDYFRKAELGPLIGSRTWGGLIGISGAPALIDGGRVTVPTFRMYNPDGTWFKEGHGVEPDIKVPENPSELAKGNDVQLQKAIEYVMTELENKDLGVPEHEAKETR
ncbi:PDZ domain-containing protein [Mangrovivirga sp. M17]|uniref:PDZ domain-containing protein n=1 Tax=Mangrovivirga halotolerans TaxID=2993936 RepID=A0ABT3RLV3_9BACT|nr:PDZ domain-containing protein [Mangrovivirga halotolerans]